MRDAKQKPHALDVLGPVTLTNLMIAVIWKTTAAVVALSARVVTTIILAVVRLGRRTRVTRW